MNKRGRKPDPSKYTKIDNIEKLPFHFENKHLIYHQIKRNDTAAIYKVTTPENHSFFEVFYIKHQPGFSLKSKGSNPKEYKYNPKEKYPNDEAFGQFAWTYNSLDMAEKKFDEIHL